jgi:hypothetical protein
MCAAYALHLMMSFSKYFKLYFYTFKIIFQQLEMPEYFVDLVSLYSLMTGVACLQFGLSEVVAAAAASTFEHSHSDSTTSCWAAEYWACAHMCSGLTWCQKEAQSGLWYLLRGSGLVIDPSG